MDSYLHRIYGIYSNEVEAEQVLERLLVNGFHRNQLKLINTAVAQKDDIEPDSDELRNDMLIDGGIGAAVGAGVGVLGEVAIAAFNVSLFIASPVLAGLVLIGWGASIGGVIGAAVGAGTKNTEYFSDLVRDAVHQGNTVLIAYAATEKQTVTAQTIINHSIELLDQVVKTD